MFFSTLDGDCLDATNYNSCVQTRDQQVGLLATGID
jgi:hypothetical protein